ncbi:MAG: DUF4405 domain-containing protein, partial [Oscillospiraceae bacterium]|nr:DUF4405 domain-containing protein [Oscillospiraceae bacterium]
ARIFNAVRAENMPPRRVRGDVKQALTPYPETYDGLLEVSCQEEAADTHPEIAGTVENMEDYDVVFLGYPNWWGDMPMIVYGFLESYDFSGKTIVPFCTHGGSGLSNTPQHIADTCPNATVADGLSVRGQTAQNDRDAAQKAVTDFLLLADMIALPVSGIMMSRHVFTFLDAGSGMALVRTVHLLASYWGLVLMSFHAGLHGRAVMGMLRKASNGKSAVRTMALCVTAALLGLWGVWAFLRREIGSYLFLRNQFVFFDFSQPLLFFATDYIAVMALFAMAGHYSAKPLKRQHS